MIIVSVAMVMRCSFLMTNQREGALHTVYLGLGSNLGAKRRNIRRSVMLINKQIGAVTRQSAYFVSKPWGFESPNDFVNIVVRCETPLSPHEILKRTQAIEREMGRTHKSAGGVYKDRIIDIDILLYDDLEVNTPDLVIPHPLMCERDFVMIPLREVCDDIPQR